MRFPIHLPEGMQTVPQRLRSSGYLTNNLTLEAFLQGSGPVDVAKTDYNFVWDRSSNYDSKHWTERDPDQPFFVQIQLNGGKYRGQKPGADWPAKVQKVLGSTTDPSTVNLPPDLPDDEVIRSDWAQYLDTVRYTDWEVGKIVKRLEDLSVLKNTVMILWSDHGVSHVRHKQFLYDGGTHIPLIMCGPGIPAGAVRTDLVEHIDIAAVTWKLAGLSPPSWMQAQDILAAEYRPRSAVFAARDRADETVDRIRSIRTAKYKYIRNYYPNRPYLQPNRYKDDKAIVQAMRRLHASDRLTREQSLIMTESRPREELYDLEADPYELRNLSLSSEHEATLVELRGRLQDWIERTNDQGRFLESPEVYLDYCNDGRPEGGGNQVSEVFRRNLELMLRWSEEKPMDSQ